MSTAKVKYQKHPIDGRTVGYNPTNEPQPATAGERCTFRDIERRQCNRAKGHKGPHDPYPPDEQPATAEGEGEPTDSMGYTAEEGEVLYTCGSCEWTFFDEPDAEGLECTNATCDEWVYPPEPAQPTTPHTATDDSTPLPWQTEPTTDHGAAIRIMDEQEVTVALCYQQPFDTWTAEANAAFIVTAVNAHAALEAAARCALADLEGIMPEFEPSGDREHPAWTTIEELRAALALAGK